MQLVSNGRANTTSNGIQLYNDRCKENFNFVISGKFSGASVTVQRSLDKENWNDIPGLIDITENNAINSNTNNEPMLFPELDNDTQIVAQEGKVTHWITVPAYTGFVRVIIKGGVQYQDNEKIIYWRVGMTFDKNQIVKIENRFYKVLDSHISGSFPKWDSLDLQVGYTPAEYDNSNATLINVDMG